MQPYYEHDGITIYHGDARDVLDGLPSGCANLLLTDPPYGMTYTNEKKKGLRGDAQRQGIRLFRSTLIDIDRLLTAPAHIYVFCHWESWPDFYDAVASYWDTKNALVWHKDNGGPGDCDADYAHDYEMILYAHKGRRELSGGRDGSVRRVLPVPGAKRDHPTEKPYPLLRYYIGKSSDVGDVVLDPFMGSGTTLRAAKDLGRRAIGIEIEERYCEVAAKRLSQQALAFEPPPPAPTATQAALEFAAS